MNNIDKTDRGRKYTFPGHQMKFHDFGNGFELETKIVLTFKSCGHTKRKTPRFLAGGLDHLEGSQEHSMEVSDLI